MRGTPFVFGDFRGGINTKASPYLVEQTQCRDALNVQSTATGAIVKRFGSTQTYAPSGATTLQSAFAVESTASDHFLTASATKLYASNTGGSIATVNSGRFAFVESTVQDSQGPVFLSNANSSDTPKYWTGSTLANWTADATSDTTVPNAAYLTIHDSRIVAAGMTSEPDTVRWSEVQVGVGTLPRHWLQINQQLFDPGDGDVITGIGRCGSNLLVFKKHKTFVIYDLATGANRRLSSTVGCVSHKSIVDTPEGTFFLSDKGVYVTNGSSLDLVSDNITPTLTPLSNKNTASGKFFNNHYYLAIDTLVFDFDLVLKSWWKHSLPNSVNAWASRYNDSIEEAYIASGTKLGQWLPTDVYTDFNETATPSTISWTWKGPWITPGEARVVYPATRKRLKALRVDGAGNVSLTKSIDFYPAETPVTAQSPSGDLMTQLFPSATNSLFGPSPADGTFFADVDNSTSPPTPTGPTTFADVSIFSQARVWGQGVARSWAFNFANSIANAKSATIQNYTVFIQERKQ